jgi:ABC-2 type transport system permease protein
MRGQPGSAFWLLQHELRMFWFNNGRRGKRRNWLAPFLVALWLGLHGLAIFLLRKMPEAPESVLPFVAMGATVLLVVLATFMFSSGLKGSVDSLFERGDVDLLLSSPLPSRSIFTVRLGAIILGVALVYLALAAPVVNAGLFIGHPEWLAVYVVIMAWAVIWCALAMLLTLLLVRVLGARKTRVVAQVISAIAGALLFLLAQAQNLAPNGRPEALQAMIADHIKPGSVFAPDSALWWVGHAVTGSAVHLLGLACAAIVLFLFTVHFTHGFFVRGLQQAVSTARARGKPVATAQGRFGQSLLQVVLRKEWRLIARDPHLLSQVLLQLLYLLPLGFLVLRSEEHAAPSVAAGLTMLAASLATSLTWIIVAAEDAPDLLQASPAAMRGVRRAKVAAAVIPILALVAIPLAWAVAHDAATGLLMCFTVVAATLCAALTGLWQGRPASRSSFQRRTKGNWIATVIDLVGTVGWAATGFLLIRAASPGQNAYDARWAGISLVLALLTLLLAWGTRRRAG